MFLSAVICVWHRRLEGVQNDSVVVQYRSCGRMLSSSEIVQPKCNLKWINGIVQTLGHHSLFSGPLAHPRVTDLNSALVSMQEMKRKRNATGVTL